jgi:hypothetical protein
MQPLHRLDAAEGDSNFTCRFRHRSFYFEEEVVELDDLLALLEGGAGV